jgi:DNA polymerase I-like protein with 3'-5' exonuclease and polymerase domains
VKFASGSNNERWDVYSYYTREDILRMANNEPALEPRLNIYFLQGTATRPKYLISSTLIYRSSKRKHYGNPQIIEDFLMQFTSRVLPKLKGTEPANINEEGLQCAITFGYVGDISSITYMSANMSMTTLAYYSDVIGSAPARSLTYVEDTSDSALQDTFLRLNMKSFDDLAQEFDNFPWYRERAEDGSWKILKDYKLIETVEQLETYCTMIFPNIKFWAVDTETTGLNICSLKPSNPLKDHIVGASFSWARNQGIYVCIDMENTDNVPVGDFVRLMKPYLENIPSIFHNALFDIKVFDELGINCKVREDTLYIQFMYDPDATRGQKALKALTFKKYGHRTMELEDLLGKGNEGKFRLVSRDLIPLYGCADTDYTFQIFLDTKPEMPISQRKLYSHDVGGVLPYVARMEYDGVTTDTKLTPMLNDINNRNIEILESLMFKFVGQIGLITQLTHSMQEKGASEEDIEAEIEILRADPEFKSTQYTFNPRSNDEISNVMYGILHYPVKRVSEKTGAPSVDKKTIKSLLEVQAVRPHTWMREDVHGVSENGLKNSDTVLIEAKKFSSKQYPFAMILSEWRKLEKLRSTFFKILLTENKDGRFYPSWSMTNAATGRIISKLQTLIGSLKKLVIPDSDDEYLIVFDFASIEYKYMFGESGMTEMIQTCTDNPEIDIHREIAAMMFKIAAYLVTPEQRKAVKAVGFGSIYGQQAFALSELLSILEEEAESLLNLFYKIMLKCKILLDSFEDVSVHPLEARPGKGAIKNKWGRMRYFDLDKAEGDKRKLSGYRRAGRNFPIQSGAREIFTIALVRLMKELKRRNYYNNGVRLVALVHDEMVLSVKKSICPYEMYEIIYDQCMLEIEGHPKYYCGISVIDNWYEGKEDLYEAPIRFVQKKIEEYRAGAYADYSSWDDPKNVVLKDIKGYMLDRYVTYAEGLVGDCSKVVDFRKLMSKFEDYFLRPRINVYFKLGKDEKISGEDKIREEENTVIACYMKVFRLKYGNDVKFILPNTFSWAEKAVVEEYDEFALEDNFKDEAFADMYYEEYEEEDTGSWDYSVPAENYQREFNTFKVIGENDGTKTLVDLVDFGVKKKIFKSGETARVLYTSRNQRDSIIFNLIGLKKNDFEKLFAYLKTKKIEHGYPVYFNSGDKEISAGFEVGKVSSEEVASVLNKDFFSMIGGVG